MAIELPLELQALRRALDGDPEFLLQARYLTTRIRVIIGEIQSFQLIIADGQVSDIDPVVSPFDSFGINIAGTKEQWQSLLAPIPPAFYQDFFSAMLHHGFRIEGDMETIMAYYPFIRRFQDVLRQVANAGVAA